MIGTRLPVGAVLFTERRVDVITFLGAIIGATRRLLDDADGERPRNEEHVVLPCVECRWAHIHRMEELE